MLALISKSTKVKQNSRSTSPLRNDGAARRVAERIESCFRLLSGSQPADTLVCPSRARDAFGPRDSSAHTLSAASLDAAHSEQLRGPASLVGNSPPNAQQPRSATGCERRFEWACFPSP